MIYSSYQLQGIRSDYEVLILIEKLDADLLPVIPLKYKHLPGLELTSLL